MLIASCLFIHCGGKDKTQTKTSSLPPRGGVLTSQSLLIEAIQRNDLKLVELLFDDIEFTDSDGNNLLHIAVQSKSDLAIIEYLIDHDVDRNQENKKKQIPCDIAVESGYLDIVKC